MSAISTISQKPPILEQESRINDLQAPKAIPQKLDPQLHKQPQAEPLSQNLQDFISKKLVKYTTYSSALINIISAPIHLFDDKNPIKKIINSISMLFTKIHLGTYSVSGLITALKQKNPFLVFSFLTEGLAAFLGLRKIYLFRGIATGTDGVVAGLKDKYKKSMFDSYADGWKFTVDSLKHSAKELYQKIIKDPMHIFKLDGSDIAIFASLIAALGGFLGMTVNEKLFGAVRDIFGGFGDFGVFKLNNPLAKSSGFAYLSGTLMDLTARVFNKGIANILNIKDTNAFERLRDSFHEAAIALDRIGSLLFLQYQQESDKDLKLHAVNN